MFNIKLIAIFIAFFTLSIIAQTRQINEKTFEVSQNGLLKIEAAYGDVNIKSWNKNKVSIKIYGNSLAKKKLKFKFNQNDNEITLKIKRLDRSWFNNFNHVKLAIEIRVPKNFNTNFETSGSDIFLYNINGDSEISTSGGDIIFEKCSGYLNCETSGGDIEIDSHKGNIRLSTSGGTIKVTQLVGDINAETSGGDIKVNSSNGKVIAATSGGDITLIYKGKNYGIDLSTSGGDIQIKTLDNISADVDLDTTGGDCELTGNNINIKKKKAHYILAKINGGGKKIVCSTTGGDIKMVCK